MIELLDKKHVMKNFDCGNELLNRYIQNQAGQDVKRKLSVCFVLTDGVSKEIQGYYIVKQHHTLSSFPKNIQKNA